MSRLRELLWDLRASFWFIPTLSILAAVLLGIGLVEADAALEADLADRWPRLFGAGAEGARGTLSAIAASMITVAGVVFSITIVALSLAASTYSPRILRTFMHDRATQLCFGVFVGVYAYCLVVLRTVRGDGGDGAAFVPSIAVLVALGLALVGVLVLVYFIHHAAVAIQVSTILARVSAETAEAIDALFPEKLGEGEEDALPEVPNRLAWRGVPATCSGYIITVDEDGLLAYARERGAVLRMELAVGDFALESLPLASLAGGGAPAGADEARREAEALARHYAIAGQRTIEQDAAFGVQQIVDVALKALSPGINDPTTARMCIDHLTALLVRLAGRRIPSRLRAEEGALRVIAKGPTFEGLVALAFEPLARYGQGKPEVLASLDDATRRLESAAPPGRRATLRRHREAIGRER